MYSVGGAHRFETAATACLDDHGTGHSATLKVVRVPGVDRPFDLSSKYQVVHGDVVTTGVQALVRTIFDQIRADGRSGLRTGAFVSGYPGSPLGGFDLALQRTGELLGEHRVTHVPGVNEDLAATSVWGSQQDALAPLDGVDGVIGMWYGKSPGVDRSGDVFRQANLHGVGRNGGVLVAAGDDPAAKSSSLPHASEIALYDAGMPVLVPGDVQQVLDFGRHAYEMSRLSGCWVGMKLVTAVADAIATVSVAEDRVVVVQPEVLVDGRPWAYAQRPRFFVPDTLEMEAELHGPRHEMARQYARANRLDVVEVDPPDAWLSIVSSGRTAVEVRHALRRLGLRDDADLRSAGVRLVRLGMIYPLDPEFVRRATRGVEQVLVVEEKRSFVELFVRDALYALADRPRVVGKRDEREAPLVPVDGELNADRLLPILAARLAPRVAVSLPPPARTALPLLASGSVRRATFCSGCPHNRSTVETSGSPVGGGVGCHAMVMSMDRGAVSYTHMGGEGAQWIGRAPFTATPHFVQNVGDGTYFHSAVLSLRAAVAAGVTMTFKLLYNGVVAMTGGQDAPGGQDVPTVAAAMALEGAKKIIVVSDDPGRFDRATRWPAGTTVWGRERLDEAQKRLAAEAGVTVLIYDQACANELRRLRKRGKAPVRDRRVVVNEAVCEGCGDCGVKSSCLSVHPVMTEFGRKTQIDQTSCNTDYSCLDGDCPSFVTVRSRPGRATTIGRAPVEGVEDLPEPASRVLVGPSGYSILSVGVGGTGVVTFNQVLVTAAHLDGLHCNALDQTGLSQKGGPVSSNLRLSAGPGTGSSNTVGAGEADLLLALDPVVAADERFLVKADRSRTTTVASSSVVPTIDMVTGQEDLVDPAELLEIIGARTRPSGLTSWDSIGLARDLFGDTASANMVLMGVAYQLGLLPVSAGSIQRAIEVNGTQVQRNVAAFRAGRVAVLSDPPTVARPGALARQWSDADQVLGSRLAEARGLTGLAATRAAALVGYQGRRVAARYLDLVSAVRSAERERIDPSATRLTEAVTAFYFKLLAYKDEYEVARLHLLPEFREALQTAVPSGDKGRVLLHPPVLRYLGLRRKIAVPFWIAYPMFRALRGLRFVRGTVFDPVGHTKVRRTERRLIREYEQDMRAIVGSLDRPNWETAVRRAQLPSVVRGYEDIKLESVRRHDRERAELLSPAEPTAGHVASRAG